MVDTVFEIINYFKPKYWWIENPQTGRMKEYITLPFYDIDYCKYSDWGYKKRTRFWTNIEDFDAKLCNKDCGNMITVKDHLIHHTNLGNNLRNELGRKHRVDMRGNKHLTNRYER